MGNPLRGEANFEAAGRTYRLKYDWNAAAEFEEAAGRPLSDALLDVAREKLSAKSLRAMLWAGLQEHHLEPASSQLAGRHQAREPATDHDRVEHGTPPGAFVGA